MAIIDWPNTAAMRPQSVEFSPAVLPEFVSSSVFNQATQSQVLGAAYYTAKVGIGPRRRSEVPDWEALIAQIADTRNRVRFWDWRWETPRGAGTGAPVVNGAGQVGQSLLTSGWTANVNGILMPGDYVGFGGGQLRRLTAQANSNALGQATLTLDQPIRTSPANGSAITTVRPTALFICTTDKRARGFRQEGARHIGPTLEFMEVFA